MLVDSLIRNENSMLTGLPCLPHAGQLLRPTIKVEVRETPGATTVDLRSVFYLSSVVAILAILLLTTLVSNCRLRKRSLMLPLSQASSQDGNPSSGLKQDESLNGHPDNERLNGDHQGNEDDISSPLEEDISSPLLDSNDKRPRQISV